MNLKQSLIMEKIVFPLMAAAIFCISCSGPKHPTFEKIENFSVRSVSASRVIVTGDLVFNNPNSFSCHLKDVFLEVFTDDSLKLTEIKQTCSTEMPANKDFTLPVEISFEPSKLINENKGLLSSVISFLNEKEVVLKYSGYINIEVLEMTFIVPIDFEEKVVLK